MGKAADPEKVASAYKELKGCKAVMITHNETSTAITNDVRAITKRSGRMGIHFFSSIRFPAWEM